MLQLTYKREENFVDNPSRAKRRKNKANKVTKANATTSEQRKVNRQVSTVAIEAIEQTIDMLKPIELSRSRKLQTFQLMLQDDSIRTCMEARFLGVAKSQANGKFVYDKSSETSVYLKDFFQHVMDNLEDQTMLTLAMTAMEMLYQEWAPFEFCGGHGTGEFSDKFVLKKLAYINPLSLDQGIPWKVKEGGKEILHLRQTSSAFVGTQGTGFSPLGWSGINPIDFRNVVYCSYSATASQPMGRSLFDALYTVWREKTLLQDLTITGVSKDFSGTPILYLPEDVLADAASDPSGAFGQQVANLQQNMLNMHTGDQSFMILPSDTQSENGSGARGYEIKFLGVEGGGKAFDVEGLVEQRRKAIFTTCGCQSLITGETGGGSMNLHEGQSNQLAHFVELDSLIIDTMWNKQIFPKLLRLNVMEVSAKDMPKWKGGSPQDISLSEKGQYFNRVMRSLPAVPDVVNSLLEDMEIDYRVPDDYTPDQVREMCFEFQEESKVGTGEGSSGQGSTAQKNSDSNVENTA